MRVADETAVPAGGALAVDRDRFAQLITERIAQHPRIELRREEVKAIPQGPCIIASGPLTADDLAHDIARLTGQQHLYFYDAIAPIVEADSIDMTIAFRQSRYEKRGRDRGRKATTSIARSRKKSTTPSSRRWSRRSASNCATSSARTRSSLRAVCRSR